MMAGKKEEPVFLQFRTPVDAAEYQRLGKNYWETINRLAKKKTRGPVDKLPKKEMENFSALKAAGDAVTDTIREGSPPSKIPSFEQALGISDEAVRFALNSQKKRPGAVSPFTSFWEELLERNPHVTAKDVKAALLADVRFTLSDDNQSIETVARSVKTPALPAKSLKISGIAAALSKAKKEIFKK